MSFLPLCLLAVPMMVAAADLSVYREFRLGATVAEVLAITDVREGEVKQVHSRPALLQEMNWRPGSAARILEDRADPVREGVLRFHNGQLYQIVVTYDRTKVEGLTDADVVASLASVYGTPSNPEIAIEYRPNTFTRSHSDVAPVIARWEDETHQLNLVRTGDQASFVIILTSRPVGALASAAAAEAVRLDGDQAPQRDADLEEKRASGRQTELEKARVANKPNFRP